MNGSNSGKGIVIGETTCSFPGDAGPERKPAPDPSQDTGTAKCGRYVLKRLLGEGGMGKVYLAQDPFLLRDVAVKVITLDSRLDPATRQEYLGRFSLEARASAKLNHPSIVTVYDAGEEEGVPWIAFEYVHGERLDEMLRNQGAPAIEKAVAVALDTASALEHAHGHGIVHRDVKPQNILIENTTGIAKLSDFGIVKAPWVGLTQEGETVGSPGYMSPEQIDGLELDGRTDLFSLGVVLYEMISGRHPFLRETVQATFLATIRGTYAPLAELRRDIPGEIAIAVDRCMQTDRSQRIASAAELIALLDRLSLTRHYRPPTSNAETGRKTGKSSGMAQTLRRGGKRIVSAAFAAAQTTHSAGVRALRTSCRTLAGLLGRISEGGHHSRPLPTAASPGARQDGSLVFVSEQQPHPPGREWARTVLDSAVSVVGRASSLPWPWAVGTGVLIVMAVGAVLLTSGARKTAASRVIVRNGTVAEALDAVRDLRARGISPPLTELEARCGDLLEDGDLELATHMALTIVELDPSRPRGHLLLGRAALKSGEYDKARAAFADAKRSGMGHADLPQEHIRLLEDLSRELMRDKAPASLVTAANTVLAPDDEALIRSWVRSSNYWLRWNCAAILEAGAKSVDYGEVYLLDLKHGATTSMRIFAVNKLCELGDARAIPALRAVAGNRTEDSRLSRAAAAVLRTCLRTTP